MFAASSVTALSGALVHQSVAAGHAERGRHEAFITHKLAISFAALAFAPFFLAFHGAPTLGESLTFTLALVPMAAAMLVARTGRLVGGHALVACGLVAFAVGLPFAAPVGIATTFAWLILAKSEGTQSGDRRLRHLTTALVGIALVALLVIGSRGDEGVATSSMAMLIGCGLAVAYALTAASTSVGATEPRARPLSDGDRLQLLTAACGDLVLVFGSGGSVERVHGHSSGVLDLSMDELLGRGFFQVVHVADRPLFLKLIADAARSNVTHTATLRVRAQPQQGSTGFAEPRFNWIEIRSLGMPGDLAENGLAASEVMTVLRDVTSMHERAQDRERVQHSIETVLQSKDEFLTNMSHELRTPLNAIIGFSEMLASHTLRPTDSDKQREYARIIHQSGQHLLSVVNSILDMSKIRSGTFAIMPEPFDLQPLIDQGCDMIRLKAEEGRVRLVRDCPDTLEPLVGDKRAVKQILINLLSNAVKFTPENGEVRVTVRPHGNAMSINVSDSGIGIDKDDLARIGDPFFQARSSLSRPFEGTGLGLSVVRGLVGLHGGMMSIESEPGKGTNVAVRLPLDCQAIPNRTSGATIETIPRRQLAEPASTFFEPRMKSIA